MSNDVLARAEQLRGERTPFVLATVVRAQRPTSAKAGDRAIVLADGTIEGFVGGACAESTVRVEGMRLLAGGSSTLLRITPVEGEAEVRDEPAEAGLVVVGNPCLSGGTLDIFLEAMRPAALLQVVGTAPIARALAELAEAAGYAVARPTDPTTPIRPDTAAVVVASHGRDEAAVLTAALRAGVPYVGLVASPRRGTAVLAELDLPEELRARVRTPAGLDHGDRTAVDVAISILAELVTLGADRRPARGPASSGLGSDASAASEPTTEDGASAAPGSARAERVPTSADPVCGMTVAAVPASLQLEHDGQIRYFCGPGCRQAFADDPDRYAA
ncbi:MAG: XdhC family protein [Micromonosporaceae bacterium]